MTTFKQPLIELGLNLLMCLLEYVYIGMVNIAVLFARHKRFQPEYRTFKVLSIHRLVRLLLLEHAFQTADSNEYKMYWEYTK